MKNRLIEWLVLRAWCYMPTPLATWWLNKGPFRLFGNKPTADDFAWAERVIEEMARAIKETERQHGSTEHH